MPRYNDQHYFLYGFGKKPAQLRLGHLCFGHYSKATDDSLWYLAGEDLEAHELEQSAHVFEIENQLLGTDPSIKISAEINALDVASLGSTFSKSDSMFVYAKTGRKIELQNPRKFLDERILTKESCRRTLERWLVVANPTLKTLVTSPKIWYLTGLYELADTVTFSQSRSVFGARGGISADLLAALGVPVGASAEAERSKNEFQGAQIKEPLVWAAKYQLLDAKYLHVKGDKPVPENLVSLGRRPLHSTGKVRDTEPTANYAELSLVESGPDLLTGSPPMESDEYWDGIRKEQKRWEKRQSYHRS
ncbi:uncharacterized protein NFIA_057730 [Aspergillus fischeri NRRL 181]|uniref:Uncharacterized protein n=1 Tax=Neosartorya fischeri (strain ATCC 1020 / DSM 3700 / CBS 544.65 / FGSC A1164 / JCM 1740 / NRRL 181 / WB 181) TaxID=331117 RepID=A1DNQ2_NEOFI|nr:conserved hypothetical protein [Aspergillus fischeri NRRL 181]EAW16423.1 conserved hypothetical protein [Aspergillus fischeri NRRL 181]KAG2024242.1 hypothetical protein GB937_003889 [Aspergillus fischeri]